MKHPHHLKTMADRYVAFGKTQGCAALVSRQLTRRFGALSYDVRKRITEASLTELNAIGSRLLVAETMEDALDPPAYEYQSDFARRYVDQGKALGRAALLIQQLARFGSASHDVERRIATASIDELDAIGERLLTASTLEEALGRA